MRVSRSWLKLLRDVRRSRWQFLAVGVVIALGVAIFIGAYGSYQNLRSSYDRTYRELHMADLWFSLEDAPAQVMPRVGKIEGVRAVEGRLVVELPIRLPEKGPGRILLRLVTLPDDRRAAVNDVKVTAGSYFSGPGQILLEDGFADFNGVEPGDPLQLLLPDGQALDLTVAGKAASPEYLWVARSERELFTVPSSFGVAFIPYGELTAALGREGRINDLALLLEPGADLQAVTDQVSDILRPYGLGEIVDRERQLSNRLLQMDLDGFESLALVFPILFLAVSSLAIYTLLNRLVQNQRGQIGVMRAMGYSRGQVLRHYLGYGLVIGVVGAALGVGLGFALSILVTRAYAQFLTVPFVSVELQPGVLAIGFAAGLIASLIAAAIPAWASASIRPAEAMRPPVPPTGRRTLLEALLPPLARLPYLIKLPLRNIFRVPRRTLYTAFGVASGVALTLVAASFLDSYDRAIELQFERIQNYDARVNFTTLFPTSLVEEAMALDGIAAAEAIAEVPVELSAGGQSHITLLQGLPAHGELLRVYSPGGRRLRPGDGILLTSAVADLLGVSKGDSLEVRPLLGGAPALELTIDDIAKQPLGDIAFARLDTAQRLLGGREVGTALLVSFRHGLTPDLESGLYGLPGVASLDLTQELRDYIDELNNLFFAFVFIMLAFGVALGLAVIFNTITINVLERQRELATMRTFGAGMRRLASMLTVENVLMGLLGALLGMPIGFGLAQYFASLYQNELFDMPTVIYLRTYGIAGLGALIVLLLAEIPAVRFLRRLDLPAVVREMST